jgi:transaldolase
VLIKIAATWEGIRAAEQLEREGIHCNLTLLFAFCQAVACGDAGVQLISPFVGRIYDWHKKAAGAPGTKPRTPAPTTPACNRCAAIYNHYKRHGIATEVMGASFRNTGQIVALAGCDLLTISPELLAQLQASEAPLHACAGRRRRPHAGPAGRAPRRKAFRWALNEDAMATEKLAEGIRAFAATPASWTTDPGAAR